MTSASYVRCRMFSPISGNLLDYDVDTKEMVDPEYGWRRDLQRKYSVAADGTSVSNLLYRQCCSATVHLTSPSCRVQLCTGGKCTRTTKWM